MRRLIPLASVTAALVASGACAISVDTQGYIEHQEQRFPATSTLELHLTTFDGAIEVRAWDRPEIVVDVEKRGEDKAAVDRLQVNVDRRGDRITLEAQQPDTPRGPMRWAYVSSRVRFIASVPKQTNLVIETRDGALSVARVSGRIDLRTGDGSIKVSDTDGALTANTADGTIGLENVAGKIDVQTSDGALRISGTPTSLHARTDDGSVVLRVREGAKLADDWVVSTDDGSISAELPATLDADLDADPGDGHVRNRLSLTNVTGGTHDEPHLHGRLGAGGHRFTLRTGDGTITLGAGG